VLARPHYYQCKGPNEPRRIRSNEHLLIRGHRLHDLQLQRISYESCDGVRQHRFNVCAKEAAVIATAVQLVNLVRMNFNLQIPSKFTCRYNIEQQSEWLGATNKIGAQNLILAENTKSK